jgi:hypothetical protein
MAAKKDDKDKLAAAVEMGHRGGVKGGPARAKSLKPEKRTSIAKHAANVRWGHEKGGKKGK